MKNPIKNGVPVTASHHELLDEARCAQFSRWMDGQLQELEQKFSGFITRHSAAHGQPLSAHFGRSRRCREAS